MAFGIKHALTMTTPDDPAYECKPSDWNTALVLQDATSGGVLYASGTTTPACSALLAANAVVLGGGVGAAPLTYADFNYSDTTKRATIGTGSGTSSGWILGYEGTNSGYSAIWPTGVTPSASNYTLRGHATAGTVLRAIGSSVGVDLVSGSTSLVTVSVGGSLAGQGLTIASGTNAANAGAQLLSMTGFWNSAGTTLTAIKLDVTNSASAAGSALIDLQVGSSTQFKVRKDGLITTGGTDGVASFGPSAVTSITVKNGIITAIS